MTCSRVAVIVALGAVAVLGGAGPVRAQGAPETPPAAADEAAGGHRPRVRVGLEVKAHGRDSDSNRFPVGFPFPPNFLPPGQTQGFEETVDAGTHAELSVVTLLLDADWGEAVAAHVKLDAIDLYDRNPTSSDHEFDVDEAWIRFGREAEPATLPARSGAYVKVGKMPKFERQDDRHLESYGLVSTAFNRFEDTGVEVGVDLGRHVYLKGTWTQGNPVFLRDPNALAGDNGTPEVAGLDFPDPALKTGVVILYDAEVEDLDVDGEGEVGAGVGLRFADDAGESGVDLLAWGYRRDLAETVPLHGTFYGGDLDLLDGPFNGLPPAPGVPPLREVFPFTGNEKEEVGANLWLYLGGFSFFGQYVDQDLGGLGRKGWEAEAAWSFDLPLAWAAGGRQLFPAIAPAVRFSRLDPDYRAPSQTPSPSFAWEWDKLDYGLRLTIVEGVDLTVEYADNSFILGSGAERENDEFLATLRFKV
jgi:hypothetical protein